MPTESPVPVDGILELCDICSEGGNGAHLDSLIAFVIHRTTQKTLAHLSEAERGSLVLRLIAEGGLQSDACRSFLFKVLCPPYRTETLVKQGHEHYLIPAGRLDPLEQYGNLVDGPPGGKTSTSSLLCIGRGKALRKEHPVMSYGGEGTSNLFATLLASWSPTCEAPLLPSELPPGLATLLLLRSPSRMLQLLRGHLIDPFIPRGWRGVWASLCLGSKSEGENTTIYTLLTCGACAGFVDALSSTFLDPLTGSGQALDAEPAMAEGPITLVVQATLRLWLHEVQRVRGEAVTNDELPNVPPVAAGPSMFHSTLAYGLHLLEHDGAGRAANASAALQAPYVLLLTLFSGDGMTSYYLRSMLDHPELSLFVPSFQHLQEEGGPSAQDLGLNSTCSCSAFLAALALRLPAAQLYMARRVWEILGSLAVAKQNNQDFGNDAADLEMRLQALLNSFVFSELPMDSVGINETAVASQRVVGTSTVESSGMEEGVRRTLRLKRGRSNNEEALPTTEASDIRAGATGITHTSAVSSDIGAAVSLMSNALLDFSVEELKQIPIKPSSPLDIPHLASFSESLDSSDVPKPTRLVITKPSHMRSLISLCCTTCPHHAAIRDVICVLMSVFLYQQCVMLRWWMQEERCPEMHKAAFTHITWRVRQWGRFLAPFGLYRYAPVTHVLLPECLSLLEEMGAATGATVAEFCRAVRALL
ncbi:hypothetical protein TRVL_04952 [Trypanosoma vivax]|nr:hypothetical protein TRVL_04952 [Trypanosoma vivax]